MHLKLEDTPSVADIDVEIRSPSESKEESALKRRRSSDSVLSASTDHLETVVQLELSRTLTESITPSLISEIDKMFRGFQEQNQNLITTANNVLSQVQLSFGQLRKSQLTSAQLLDDNRAQTIKQEQVLTQLAQLQGTQRTELNQSQAEARFGFQVLESVVTDHESQLRAQTAKKEPLLDTSSSSTCVQFGQDDRGLGRQPMSVSGTNSSKYYPPPTSSSTNNAIDGNNTVETNFCPRYPSSPVPCPTSPTQSQINSWPNGIKVTPPSYSGYGEVCVVGERISILARVVWIPARWVSS